MKTRILYLENKTTGEARIGRGRFSRTYQTGYYQGRTLMRAHGVSGNFRDADTGEEFWVSGPRKRGPDTHWAERVPVSSDEDVRAEYEQLIRR